MTLTFRLFLQVLVKLEMSRFSGFPLLCRYRNPTPIQPTTVRDVEPRLVKLMKWFLMFGNSSQLFREHVVPLHHLRRRLCQHSASPSIRCHTTGTQRSMCGRTIHGQHSPVLPSERPTIKGLDANSSQLGHFKRP